VGPDARLLSQLRAVRGALAADVALGVGAAACVLAQAVLIAHVVADAFAGASLAREAPWLALLAAAVTARAGAGWGFETVGRRASLRIVSALRLGLVRARLRDRPAALDGAASAELATAAVAGADALAGVYGVYVPQLVLAVVVPVAVLALAAAIDPLSAALMVLTLPLVPLFGWLIGRATARRARERWRELSLMSGHFLDVVRGLPTLRAFDRGEAQVERVAEVSDRYRVSTMSTLRLAFLSGAVLELASTLGIALVAVTVGVRLVHGGIAFRPALTVLLLAPELYLPLRTAAAGFHQSADGLAAAERLLELGGDSPAPAAPRATAASPRAAAIRLEGVTYAYPTRATPALDRVDLELAPGERVALVGPSGAGKSTVAALVLGLCTPLDGRVTAGSVDLASCDLAAWRRQVAWLPQRPALLRGTVADNIRLGDPTASDARVAEAARRAGAADFVAELTQGYDTVVGDGGRRLSAGQLQRIALARALLRDVPLLILDEPTANLDTRSAAHVAATIAALPDGRTLLLVTHDAQLARVADRTVELGAPPREPAGAAR
jgi:thiol reductant ABC exporter CydD subunit